MAKTKAKTTVYTEGEYGYRVRVLRRSGRKNFYIAWWDPVKRQTVKECLGHADEELAREQCRELSDALRRGIELGLGDAYQLPVDGAPEPAPDEVPPGNVSHAAMPPAGGAPTAVDTKVEPVAPPDTDDYRAWAHLFKLYRGYRGKHKKGAQPAEDLRRERIWMAFVRKEKIRSPDQMDNDNRDEFVRQRRYGHLLVDGVDIRLADPERPGEEVVTPTTVFADVVFLNTVLNWGTEKYVDGKPLVFEKRMKLPRGMKTALPKRPVATHDDVLDLRRVADDVDPQHLFGCFVRLHDALGWRVSAVCAIKASEVCLDGSAQYPYGYIIKNPLVDKRGHGQAVPLTRHSRATLKRLLCRRGLAPGDAEFLFPAPKNPHKGWSRWHHRDLMKRAERKAKISPIGGSHAIRRKWASERKDHPLPDLMRAGGWRDRRSLESYLHADAETTLEVVSRPTRRIRRIGS